MNDRGLRFKVCRIGHSSQCRYYVTGSMASFGENCCMSGILGVCGNCAVISGQILMGCVFMELFLEKATVCLIKWILFLLVGEQASKKRYRVCVTV